MADNEDDKFTHFLFNMIDAANLNRTLKDIILANKKNKDKTALEWSSSDRFKLMSGKGFQFVMKYKDGKPYALIEDRPEDDLATE